MSDAAVPRVSVVMPAYNHEAFVGEAVASVLDGAWRDVELVVVDDGSTDRTAEVVAERAGDPRLVLLRQPNRGAHAALNRGLAAARGELLLVLDSDDAFAPQRIPRAVAALDAAPDTLTVASWLEVVDAEGAPLGIKHGWRDLPPWPAPTAGPFLSDLGDPRLALLETNYVATTSNLAFRRRLIVEHGLRFAPLRYCHDWDFLLQAAALGGLELLPEPLVRYRVHAANTIREGEAAAGQGAMRFEILWVVVRHTAAVLAAVGGDRRELERRWWRSAPRFGRPDLLAALLALRGDGPTPPPAYDALLEPDNPFRRAAETALGSAECGVRSAECGARSAE